MSQPNPWILFIGGGSMLNVGLMVSGAHAPTWVRYGGMIACIALGLTSMGLGLWRYFQKKPEPPRMQRKKRTPVELLPETRARRKSTPEDPRPPS